MAQLEAELDCCRSAGLLLYLYDAKRGLRKALRP